MDISEWDKRLRDAAAQMTERDRERMRDLLAQDDLAWQISLSATLGKRVETAMNKAINAMGKDEK